MSPFEFVRSELGGVEDDDAPLPAFRVGDTLVMFIASFRGDVLFVNEIEVDPTGQGIGTRLVEAFRVYADRHDYQLRFRDVTAIDFFDRFEWLTPVETGEVTEGRQVTDYLAVS